VSDCSGFAARVRTMPRECNPLVTVALYTPPNVEPLRLLACSDAPARGIPPARSPRLAPTPGGAAGYARRDCGVPPPPGRDRRRRRGAPRSNRAGAPARRRTDPFLLTWDDDRPLLVHCVAGISRSTAAALIAMAAHGPGREMESAHALREVAPHAHPNRRLIQLADEILGSRGRLVSARDAMGAAQPATEGPLVRVPRTL
jgi:hypothetical protein